jgi:hypothetical protein
MTSPKFSTHISAKVLANSINTAGIQLTTFEIEYPRFILAELNTHRMLSKNSASSRAIPIGVMHEHIRENTAGPVHWGINQPGMCADNELPQDMAPRAAELWIAARDLAIRSAANMAALGLHKQIVNRVTEPWMLMKTVISGTEWANFWHLRNHPDAQPEIKMLAARMHEAYVKSVPVQLFKGEWHLPYISTTRNPETRELEYSDGVQALDLETAKKISASCCAQVSYRKSDLSIDKAEKVFDRLINSQPVHASPVEHQATPMTTTSPNEATWPPGITHRDRQGYLWSGNFRGWIQHRKLLSQEAVWDYN